MQYVSQYDTPLGKVTLASDGAALTGLWFVGQKYYGSTLQQPVSQEVPLFRQVRHWLALYFAGKEPDFTPPLRYAATPFQRTVWDMLQAIPYGKTTTYGEIAQRLSAETGGGRMSPQAVGGAVGHNPISLIIPCHRVLGADGSMTGYAGGIDRKLWLLRLERADLPRR